jgi:hypothetical protein
MANHDASTGANGRLERDPRPSVAAEALPAPVRPFAGCIGRRVSYQGFVASAAERQYSSHRGIVNVWPHSLHRTQSSASHVCRRIIARGSVSELAQRLQGGVEV